MTAAAQVLGLQWLQRDWLSANHIVFAASGETPAAVVDTGYARHAGLTLALVERALAGQALGLIVNTHLHSDHCGGNHALQQHWPGVRTQVPAPSFEAVRHWQASRLSYEPTGQHCPRFQATGALQPGGRLRLGPAQWQVHAAPGHDPDAVLLFEPQTRTLISGDALWEDRLAIIFPELEGGPGFALTRATLALIEQLAPRWVIPGHGAAFEDAGAALAASRRRLDGFERDPTRHLRHAARALAMFHMLEEQQQQRAVLEAWLQRTPLFQHMAQQLCEAPQEVPGWAAGLVDSLVDDGLLVEHAGEVRLAASAPG
jgi:glyoxylase-like metal-dependent hydrolase (beta-lactamase superfamily II)